MKLLKFLLIALPLIFINSSVYSSEDKTDCPDIKKWNVIKKLECKLRSVSKPVASKIDESTESITSKKTIVDFFKKKKK